MKDKPNRLEDAALATIAQHADAAPVFDGAVGDIADRQPPEQALLTKNAYLRAILNNVPYLVWLKDREGRFLAVNDLFAQSCGRQTAEEVVGKTDMDVWPADLANKYRSDDAEVMARRTHKRTEEPIAAQTGLKWFETFKTPILDANGEVIGTTGVARDITERKRTDDILRRERDFNQAALDSLPGLFYLFDDTGRFLRVNKNFEKVSGYSAEDIARMNPLDFFTDTDKQRVADAIQRVFQTTEASVEANFLSKDNIETPYFFTGALFQFDQKSCVMGTGVDITERQRAAERQATLEAQLHQAQKMESVGRLAGGVAHDFNNMLGVILGHTELAIEQVDPAQPLHADLQEIRDAAVRSADLTRQLLAFARKQTVAPEVLDLNDAVAGMLKMLHRLIGENIHLKWQPRAGLWPVKVDPSQIDQILANLCVNARDAITGVGKLTIETGNSVIDEDYCAAHAGCVPGQYVLLGVSDDGCGIDKDTLLHLFEPFFTTKEIGHGTGLGLATVYGIVKQNNGFINVYSEPNHGTTFKIYLPRCVDDAAQARTEDAATPAPLGLETILLVEDEPSILSLTARMLTRQGYTVLVAGTPGEAISLAKAHTGEIHLLITDVIMPEMNGRDLARALLSVHPHLEPLFMSGYTADIIAHHGVLDEGVQFIQKPFSRRDLAIKVRDTLDAQH